MTATLAPTTGSRWAADRLDPDAHLARLGLTPRDLDGPDLVQRLHRAHVAAIPFENVDVVLGRRIDLDLDAIQAKLVRRRRGGYCFEHTLLHAAALERLGLEVVRLTGRVQPDRDGPRTHQLVVAHRDGRWWLTDVGFGGNLPEPLPLAEGTVRQGDWTYRLRRQDDRWRLQSRTVDRWHDLYEFTTEPTRPVDLDVANHYTSTHPRSPFVGQLVVFAIDRVRRVLLQDHRLTIERPDGQRDQRTLTTTEVLTTLDDAFGIDLDDHEQDQLATHLDQEDHR